MQLRLCNSSPDMFVILLRQQQSLLPKLSHGNTHSQIFWVLQEGQHKPHLIKSLMEHTTWGQCKDQPPSWSIDGNWPKGRSGNIEFLRNEFTFARASVMKDKLDLVIMFSYEILEMVFVLRYGGNKIWRIWFKRQFGICAEHSLCLQQGGRAVFSHVLIFLFLTYSI